MLTSLRRSAGLLFVLFAGHLSMVAGGAVCTSSSMASMNESSAGQMAAMPGMGAETAATPADDMATSDHPPCSSPSQGTCVASMTCVNALGAPQGDVLATASDAWSGAVIELTVTMPVAPGSAPDIPPPRA